MRPAPWYTEFMTAVRSRRASYVALSRSGELDARADALEALAAPCRVCPRECGVDRRFELGECRTPLVPSVASWARHLGEEAPISGRFGSGTIFLANCNLRCAFCQNHDISQRPQDFAAREVDPETLAQIFLELQDAGVHNLNWVSPSHQVPALVRALAAAARRGLTLPVVYNTNGYDAVETLGLLEGVVDVWMPDLKFADASVAAELTDAPDYPKRARAALAEMYRQVGDAWELDPGGAVMRGMLVRILVLPGGLAGEASSLAWIARELSPRVAISLMAQYRPCHRADRVPGRPELARRVSAREWRAAVAALEAHMTGDRHAVQGLPRSLGW